LAKWRSGVINQSASAIWQWRRLKKMASRRSYQCNHQRRNIIVPMWQCESENINSISGIINNRNAMASMWRQSAMKAS